MKPSTVWPCPPALRKMGPDPLPYPAVLPVKLLSLDAVSLSVRQLEAHLVRAAAQHIQHKTGANPDLARLERELGEHLGTQVRIDHTRSGNGQLVLKYGTLDALQGLLERLGYHE